MLVNYIFVLTIVYYTTMLFFFKKKFDKKIYFTLFTIFLYPIGYLAIYYDGQRYIWITTILLYVLSAYALNMLFLKYEKSRAIRYYVPAALCVSLIALTLVRVNRDYKLDVSELNNLYYTSNEIIKHYNMQNKNIASQGGNWNHTLDLSYF